MQSGANLCDELFILSLVNVKGGQHSLCHTTVPLKDRVRIYNS